MSIAKSGVCPVRPERACALLGQYILYKYMSYNEYILYKLNGTQHYS